MSEDKDMKEDIGADELPTDEQAAGVRGKFERVYGEEGNLHKLTGMYKNWFLDYASYVILERAVPHVEDGLKPVQRRILHAMKCCDDGRYNKVANIVGQAMQYHPHGDASIKDALVQLGQKDLLIDCQGNWGNILTGDDAAAGRYIEARLSKFALDVVFNKKTTEWMRSYDGRNEEPVTLPIKFPLLLAQGTDGIAVGLASKILPHNFNELINACIAHLRGEDFMLLPDFPTGGLMDASRYNDGLRGGVVKVRARISKIETGFCYYLTLRMERGDAASLAAALKNAAAQGVDAASLVRPTETPLYEKYDNFLPGELLRAAFAADKLNTEEMTARLLSW